MMRPVSLKARRSGNPDQAPLVAVVSLYFRRRFLPRFGVEPRPGRPPPSKVRSQGLARFGRQIS